MRVLVRLLLGTALALAAGCDGGPLLRDDYMGKSWLEPEREPTRVERDAEGNPVLPETGGRADSPDDG